MKSIHTLQKSNHKRVDEVKWMRNALASGESPFSEQERAAILLSPRCLGLDGDIKLRQALSAIWDEVGDDPMLILKAINMYIR